MATVPTVLERDVPACALAVYAHPDDPEISAGGTLAAWAEDGADVHVLITTRGDKGTSDPDADTEELARRRIEETDAAAKVLGVKSHHHLEYSDGELPDALSLVAFSQQPGVALAEGGEWSADIASFTTLNAYSLAIVTPTSEVDMTVSTATKKFRCIIPLLG